MDHGNPRCASSVGRRRKFNESSPVRPAGGPSRILVRLDEATFVAYEQQCTHLTCPVVPAVERGELLCPCHHGVFDLRTGSPLAGPPRRPLARVTLEVRDGWVTATGVEGRTQSWEPFKIGLSQLTVIP